MTTIGTPASRIIQSALAHDHELCKQVDSHQIHRTGAATFQAAEQGGGELPAYFKRKMAGDEARLRDKVGLAQAFMQGMGVQPSEGTGPINITFDPTFYNAAYFPDEDAMVFGTHPTSGIPFHASTDVVFHEYGHRIVNHLAEPGRTIGARVVHESVADTLANAYDTDDWSLGEGMGESIRSMVQPGRFGEYGHVRDIDKLERSAQDMDYDGIVAAVKRQDSRAIFDIIGTSWIPFKTMTGVGLIPNFYTVGGITSKAAARIGQALGRSEMGQLYIDALRVAKAGGADIKSLVGATMHVARQQFGPTSKELAVVRDAWTGVGMLDANRRVRDLEPRLLGAAETATTKLQDAFARAGGAPTTSFEVTALGHGAGDHHHS